MEAAAAAALTAQAACAVKQSSLIYTLLDTDEISWSDFSLIIRSLHSYDVQSIDEDQECKTITVTVGYFANAKNARKRLGRASEFIAVSRESSNVRRDEIQTLQQLRRKFGFGRDNDDEECPPSKPHKKRRYADRN